MPGRPSRTTLLRVLAGVLVVLLGAAVGTVIGGAGSDGDSRPAAGTATATTTSSGAGSTGGRTFLDDVLPRDPSAIDREVVNRVFASLDDRQKVAQVFAFGLPAAVSPARVAALRGQGIGAVVVAVGDQRGLARGLGAPRGVAPLVVADADDDIPARTLRANGIRGVLAPRLDVESAADASDASSVATDDAETYRDAGVLGVATPFPGLGGASQPPTEGPANVTATAAQLRRVDMRPFAAAVDAGVPAVQMANGLYTFDDFVTPGSLSRKLITGELRRRLGFTGMVVTGNLAEAGVTALETPARAAPEALRAGADLLYVGGAESDQRAAFDAVLAPLRATKPDRAYRQRLDDAVRTVLTTKRAYGLLR